MTTRTPTEYDRSLARKSAVLHYLTQIKDGKGVPKRRNPRIPNAFMVSAAKVASRGFKYKSDGKRDTWRILTDIMHFDKPRSEGDCEDMALTVLWLLAGRKKTLMFWWLLTRQARIVHAKVGGEGHAMLRWGDHLWIDNITPVWGNDPVHDVKYARTVTAILIKMIGRRKAVIGIVILYALLWAAYLNM